MHLDIYRDAAKFIEGLEPKRFKQVVSKIVALLKDPRPNDSEVLKGYPFLRIDAGEHRIVYTHTETVITVILVGKRNDDEVYKRLKRDR